MWRAARTRGNTASKYGMEGMLVPVESSTVDVGVIDPIADIRNGSPEVSVVLPCLNEADSVGMCVREALTTMESQAIDGEVLVVDNGSTDGSAEIARAAGARVISELRPGYGRALRTGIEASRGVVVVMADADWSYDFGKLASLISPVRDGEADLVLGTRLEGAS